MSKKRIKAWLQRYPRLYHFLTLPKFIRHYFKARQLLSLNYPFESRPRYGHGLPVHRELQELLNGRRSAYAETLQGFLAEREHLAAIPAIGSDDSGEPRWLTPWVPLFDAAALYCLPARHRPKTYLEIGSGQSTKFVRRSVRDHDLNTQIVSIDPHPRAEVDVLCDRVIRSRLEDVDQTPFSKLEPGDILYMDGSHRCFMNSDVSVLFLEILPRLQSGVIVGIHDIWLPSDYPPKWAKRYYSEHYLLAVYLLARGAENVILPCRFISDDPVLREMLDPVWSAAGLEEPDRHGESFWLRVP